MRRTRWPSVISLSASVLFICCNLRDTGSSPPSATSGYTSKSITELTPDELEVVNSLCATALEGELGTRMIARAKTTFYRLPASEDNMRGIGLVIPLTFESASIVSAYDIDGIRHRLKARISSLAARHGLREYSVAESLVVTSPAGGTATMPFDSVTIIPTKIMIN